MKFLLTFFNLIVASWACEHTKQSISGISCELVSLNRTCGESDITCKKYTQNLNCPQIESCATPLGDSCPNECPKTCKPNKKLCENMNLEPCSRNINAQCINKKVASKKPGAEWCENPCPVECPEGEYLCESVDSNGCKTITCNQESCPDTSNNNGCLEGEACCDANLESKCQDPKSSTNYFCVSNAKLGRSNLDYIDKPDNCPEGQVACAGSIDMTTKCPSAGTCVDNETDCPNDDQGCPKFSPLDCPEGQVECGDYTPEGCWSNFCASADSCPAETHEQNGCIKVDEPECKENQKKCQRGEDLQGCPQAPICVDNDETFLCNVCEPACSKRTEKVCTYENSNPGKCPEKRCVEKKTPCDYADVLMWLNLN